MTNRLQLLNTLIASTSPGEGPAFFFSANPAPGVNLQPDKQQCSDVCENRIKRQDLLLSTFKGDTMKVI